MQIISVVNQKGGVGKTTTCMNIAASFAAINRKTLLIDLDSQGNASTGLGVSKSARNDNIYNVLVNKAPIKKAIIETDIRNLYIIPSVVDLAAAEIDLKEAPSREYILRDILRAVSDEFEYVIIDCPPALGLLTINALVAADELIIPMQCEFFALEGLSQLMQTVKIIQSGLNPNLRIKGILLTMFDKRNRLSAQVAREVKESLGSLVFDTIIPRNVRIAEAPSFGKPAIAYDINSSGSQAYIKLVKEILTKLTKKRHYYGE